MLLPQAQICSPVFLQQLGPELLFHLAMPLQLLVTHHCLPQGLLPVLLYLTLIYFIESPMPEPHHKIRMS